MTSSHPPAKAYSWILTPSLILSGLAISAGVWWLATADIRERRGSWREFLALEETGALGSSALFERWASFGPDPEGKFSPRALVHLDGDADHEAVVAVWHDHPKLGGTIDYPYPNLQLVVLNGAGEKVWTAFWSQFAPGNPVFSKVRPEEIGTWCLEVRGAGTSKTCYFVVRNGRLLAVRGDGPLAALNEFSERGRWLEFLQCKDIGVTLAFLKWLGFDGRYKSLDAREREQVARLAVSTNAWLREAAESLNRP